MIPHAATLMDYFQMALHYLIHWNYNNCLVDSVRRSIVRILSILASDGTHHTTLMEQGILQFVTTALAELDLKSDCWLAWNLAEILVLFSTSQCSKARLSLARHLKNTRGLLKILNQHLCRHSRYSHDLYLTLHAIAEIN